MALDAWTLNPRDNRERSEKSQVRREIELFQVPGFGRRSGLDLGIVALCQCLDLLKVGGGCIPAGSICVQTYSCLTLRSREDGVDSCQDDLL